MSTCGVYCIENIINNKKYIGQSININSRWQLHKWELRNNRHSNSHLQNSWNKYGEKNFTFYILEQCNENLLDEKERYYIDTLRTTVDDYGYNLDSGGNSHKHHCEETKQKISFSNTGKTNSEETRRKISLNRKGKMCGSNHFRYGKKLPEWHAELLRMYAKSRSGDSCYQAKKVICLNTGEIFTTILAAAEKYKDCGVNAANIMKCCKGQRNFCGRINGNTPILWSYYKDDVIYVYTPYTKTHCTNNKKVSQYDKQNNYIATFDSAREAERRTGISYKQISQVCTGNKPSAHGYVFKFTP